MAKTHTPTIDSRNDDGTYRSDGDYKLTGKTLCGKSVGISADVTAGQPTCGQCARNLRTVTGTLRDGREEYAKMMQDSEIVDPRETPQTDDEKRDGMARYFDTSWIETTNVDPDPFEGIVDVKHNDGWDA